MTEKFDEFQAPDSAAQDTEKSLCHSSVRLQWGLKYQQDDQHLLFFAAALLIE
jgi:hypothetical protein